MCRGVPQIEVAFDLDNNGIMHVSAVDKGSGRTNKIVITNEKGRLSKDEIDRMLKEADRFKAEDQAHAERVVARNTFESYAYSVKRTVEDDKLQSRLGQDRDKVRDAVDKALSWLAGNEEASKEELEGRRKDLEDLCRPVIMKIYQNQDDGDAHKSSGPKVEEVD